jgi:alpha-glucosidase (family GH31 glycosyl hydrolase)
VLIIDCQAYKRVKKKGERVVPSKPEDWDNDTVRPASYYTGRAASNYEWASEFGDTKKMFNTVKGLRFKTILSSGVQGPLYDWIAYDPTVPKECERLAATFLPRNIDGIDSWRQDNSEKYHRHAKKPFFRNGYEAHNLFGALWAKNAVEALESIGFYGRPVVSRGGPVGGHRYIIPWPGDLPHGLDLLPVDLNWVRNGGLSAYPFTTVNLGGWGGGHGLEEQNLIRRVINIIPIVPVSQLVGWNKTGENAMLPWDMSPGQQNLLRYYLKFRYRLHPYIYSSALEGHLTGRPILAALVFDYPDDPNTYNKDYHFMLGRQILTAPVLEETDKWDVYLPKGTWVHYWTGKKYAGSQTVTVDAPLYGRDGLPLFVKAGAIIPMMPEMSYVYEKKPDPITLDVYPAEGRTSTCIMYDRKTPKNSPVTQTRFKCSDDATKIEISTGESDTAYELWVHSDNKPASVTVDSKELTCLDTRAAYDAAAEGWYYGPGCFYGSEKLATLNIKVAKDSGSRLIRIAK